MVGVRVSTRWLAIWAPTHHQAIPSNCGSFSDRSRDETTTPFHKTAQLMGKRSKQTVARARGKSDKDSDSENDSEYVETDCSEGSSPAPPRKQRRLSNSNRAATAGARGGKANGRSRALPQGQKQPRRKQGTTYETARWVWPLFCRCRLNSTTVPSLYLC